MRRTWSGSSTEPLAIDVGATRRAVPVAADGYRSLGVYESPKGTRATQDTHVRKRVTAVCNLALYGLRWFRLDLVPPAVGVQAIVSHVLPAPMYAAGACCAPLPAGYGATTRLRSRCGWRLGCGRYWR